MPYRLYVDEVGNDDMFHTGDERHRYLSLSGVAMDPDHVRDYATPAVNALKSILKHDPDKHCILHRKDIMNKNGVFKSLGDAAICQAFDASMVKLFTDAGTGPFPSPD